MNAMPRAKGFDHTLAFLRDPYRFIGKWHQRLGSDVFEARLLVQPTICMTGPEAARAFYDPERLQREGAMPNPVRKTLIGEGGVQGLDDAAHHHRKMMLMATMTPECIDDLRELTARTLHHASLRWASLEGVVLYDEIRDVLTRAVCKWAGVPLDEEDVTLRKEHLTALFQHAGTIGIPHLGARLARKRCEAWLSNVIESYRSRVAPAEPAYPAEVIAHHRDRDGKLLDTRVAAVELLNLLRPTVALSVYIVFCAHALHHHPVWRERLQAADDAEAERFVHEVRRFYPFFPAVAARVRHDFEWQGFRFPEGRRVMLDLYGTNHDPRTWGDPEAFRPDRFKNWDGSAFNFIPQGGGDHVANHRCAGEWLTLALMKEALTFLTRSVTYEVPEQDLRIDMTQLPALPPSGMVLGGLTLLRTE